MTASDSYEDDFGTYTRDHLGRMRRLPSSGGDASYDHGRDHVIGAKVITSEVVSPEVAALTEQAGFLPFGSKRPSTAMRKATRAELRRGLKRGTLTEEECEARLVLTDSVRCDSDLVTITRDLPKPPDLYWTRPVAGELGILGIAIYLTAAAHHHPLLIVLLCISWVAVVAGAIGTLALCGHHYDW